MLQKSMECTQCNQTLHLWLLLCTHTYPNGLSLSHLCFTSSEVDLLYVAGVSVWTLSATLDVSGVVRDVRELLDETCFLSRQYFTHSLFCCYVRNDLLGVFSIAAHCTSKKPMTEKCCSFQVKHSF